jgi:hypothetical protein
MANAGLRCPSALGEIRPTINTSGALIRTVCQQHAVRPAPDSRPPGTVLGVLQPASE